MNRFCEIVVSSLLVASASVAIVTLFALEECDASEVDAKVIIGVGSRHLDSVDHRILNEYNPSIGFEAYDIQAVYVSKNSWDHNSWYITYTPDYKVNDYLSITLNVGIATGYKCNLSVVEGNTIYHNSYCSGSGVVPMGAVTIDYSPFANKFAISTSINPDVVMLSFSYSI